MDPLHRFLRLFPDAKKQANGWYEARCPAHEDRHASFGFKWVEGGKPHVALRCQAGCTREQILGAVGLVWQDLYPARERGGGFRVVAAYDYRSDAGEVLYQSVRLEPKDFRQRQPWRPVLRGQRCADDGSWSDSGKWVWGVAGCRRVLYRLPEVLAAVKAGELVFVVEGEKDADNLAALGLAATTNVGGADKWLPEYTEALAGADVVLLGDNDEPGRKHVQGVSWALRGRARRVRVVELPGLPEHGDVSDWLGAGGTRAELEGLVALAPEGRFRLSDVGNAERLIGRCGQDLRWVAYGAKSGVWRVWDGTVWGEDRTGGVTRRCIETVRGLYAEAAGCEDEETRRKLGGWGLRSESGGSLSRMEWVARALGGMAVLPEVFDADPWLLNCPNGTVDLRTGELRAPRREDMLSKVCGVEFRPDVPTPRWERFLAEIFGGRGEVVEFVERALGYALSGDTSERCMFILWGETGRNGKTTLMETVGEMVGNYGTSVRVAVLMASEHGEASPNDLVRLPGARFVWSSETREGRCLNEERIKALCGGRDRLTAMFKYQEAFEFHATHTLFLATNARPELRGVDQALRDRIYLVPFNVRFFKPGEIGAPGELPSDPGLEETLRAEAPGILARLVRGCLEWQAGGLRAPDTVRAATTAYFAEQDLVGRFLDDRCEVSAGDLSRFVSAAALYKAFCAWCEELGSRPLTSNAFGRRLTARGLVRAAGGRGSRWHGVELLPVSADGEVSALQYEPGSFG